MAFPGFSHIYDVRDPFLKRALRAELGPENHELMRQIIYQDAPFPASPPLLTRYMGGPLPLDIVWTGALVGPVINGRVRDLLIQEHITGWRSYQVHIKDRARTVHTGYWHLVVDGPPCGPIDWTRGPLLERTDGWPKGKYYRGGWFDPATWSGADIFRSENNGMILATDRVMQTFNEANVENVEFTPLDQCEIDKFIVEMTNPQ